jgi:hypothetical protein
MRSLLIEQLASCKEITNWVGIDDKRVPLNRTSSHYGWDVSRRWPISHDESEALKAHIKRLVIPGHISLRGLVTTGIGWNNGATVDVVFTSQEDWLNSFPISETSPLPGDAFDSARYWGAIALLGNGLGMTVCGWEGFDENTGDVSFSRVDMTLLEVVERVGG